MSNEFIGLHIHLFTGVVKSEIYYIEASSVYDETTDNASRWRQALITERGTLEKPRYQGLLTNLDRDRGDLAI